MANNPMRKSVRWFSVLVLSTVCLCGCNFDDLDVSVDVTSEANLCNEVAEVMCSNMFQCCTGGQIESVLGGEISDNEQDCHRDMKLHCEEALATLLYSLELETVSLNADALNDCLSASLAPADTCFDVEMEPLWLEACSDVIFVEGNQSEDQSCYWDFECAEDAYCTSGMTCRGLPTLGEDCSSQTCASDYYCAPDDYFSMICQEYQQLQESCSPYANDGMLCDPETMYCEDWDSSGYGSDGWCLAKKGLGVSCTGSDECESNQCAPGHCDNYSSYSCFEDDDCWDDGQCLGDIVCVDEPEVTNYCYVGLNLLGLFPTDDDYWD